jgi:hypothetical protein
MTYMLVMQVLNFMENDWFPEERLEDELTQSPVMFLYVLYKPYCFKLAGKSV